MTYASTTSVPVARTRDHIEQLVTGHGGFDFAYGTRDREGVAAISFMAHNKQVRMVLPLPGENDQDFLATAQGRARTAAAARTAYEQALRSKWRALFLVVKAKFEAVESGIVTFEEEFLAHIVLPSGQTVFEHVATGLEDAYLTGVVPPALQIGPGR